MTFTSQKTKPFLLAFLLLAACSSPLLNFSPERAALSHVMERGQSGAQVASETMKILQMQEFQGKTFVLVSFQLNHPDGRTSSCLQLVETYQEGTGWRAGSSGGGCSSGAPDGQMDISSGTSARGELAYSYIMGTSNHDQVVEILVTWDDDDQQHVSVVNQSFVALKGGLHKFSRIDGVDAQGQDVITQSLPQVAPGKQ